MPAAYSRIVQFSSASASPICVRIPSPPRGKLTRLTLKRTGGASLTGTFTIYDRKGACAGETDLNVRLSGDVATVVTSGGKARVAFTDAHGLYVGDTFEIKESSIAAYNVTHTVTSIVDDDTVVTDVNYTADGAGGLWQTLPFLPTRDPSGHIVFTGTVAAAATTVHVNLDIPYENRDNQNEVTRIATGALWLEFTASAVTAATWELGFTVHSVSFVC
jgi:hypothetical protein